MISLEDLGRMARLKGLSLGYAEKDYLIDIALLSISRSTKDEMIFKGGTCLSKIYKMDRFSEDIDFTAIKEIKTDNLIKNILSDLLSFGIESKIRDQKKGRNSITWTIRTKGPLYKGIPVTFSNIRIDVNTKSSIDMEPKLARYASLYPDIPEFSLLVMHEKEILAEKVRAIMTRKTARDVYDLWFLLGKGTKIDLGLVKRKLEYYGEKWSRSRFEHGLRAGRAVWETELGPLLERESMPDFSSARKSIMGALPSLPSPAPKRKGRKEGKKGKKGKERKDGKKGKEGK